MCFIKKLNIINYFIFVNLLPSFTSKPNGLNLIGDISFFIPKNIYDTEIC